MSNKTYDILKIVALLIVPFCAFITSVAGALGYDASVPVAILTAFDTFLGAILKISTDAYYKEGE